MRSSASAGTRGTLARAAGALRSDRGSAVAEWALVAGILAILFLTVLQLGFAMYVRAVAIDAAAEGARYAGLAGSSLAAGEERARDVLATALSPAFAEHVDARYAEYLGMPAIEVRVRAPLPLMGLVGLPDGLEVAGHAPVESLG